jgi:hypothetical protein
VGEADTASSRAAHPGELFVEREKQAMPKFTYSDIVKARSTADAKFRPGERAWVIAVLDNRVHNPFVRFPPGVMYTVEFEDGEAVDVHEDYLERG